MKRPALAEIFRDVKLHLNELSALIGYFEWNSESVEIRGEDFDFRLQWLHTAALAVGKRRPDYPAEQQQAQKTTDFPHTEIGCLGGRLDGAQWHKAGTEKEDLLSFIGHLLQTIHQSPRSPGFGSYRGKPVSPD